MANTIIGSQLGASSRARILAEQRATQRQIADVRNQFSQSWAAYNQPGPPSLNLEPAAVADGVDQAQAFVARQLVAQAQSDYRLALERGKVAEAEAARVRMETAVALEEAAAQRARADKAEAQLRKLRPEIVRRLIPSSGPGSHELRWPWLAASWALLLAGIGVCLL